MSLSAKDRLILQQMFRQNGRRRSPSCTFPFRGTSRGWAVAPCNVGPDLLKTKNNSKNR